MAFGTFYFYVFPRLRCNVKNQEDYFIGSFTGDTYADDEFDLKIKRINAKLTALHSLVGFTSMWAAPDKPYNPLTPAQKYKRMVSKAYNEHKAAVQKIIQANTLFVDDFLIEQDKKLHLRIDQLKKRYQQC